MDEQQLAALMEMLGGGGPNLAGLGQLGQQRMAQAQTQPLSLEDLLRFQRQSRQARPIAPGETPGSSAQPQIHSYAPQGTIFLGGSPFKVNERPAMIQNGLVLATRLSETLRDIRKQQAEAKANKPAAGSAK